MGQMLGITVGVGVAMGASVATSFQSLGSRVTGLSAKMKEMKTHQTAATKLMAAETSLTAAKTAHLTAATAQTQKTLDRAQLSFNRAAQSAKRYGLDAATITKTHAGLTTEIAKTESALGRLQQRQENQATRKEMLGEIATTAASAYVVTRPIMAAKDYESEFAGLKKVANFKNADEEEALKQDMLRISSETGLSATDVVKLGTGAAQAGVANNPDKSINVEMMKTFVEDAAKMAVAFDISAEEAAENMRKLQGTMGLTPAKARAMALDLKHPDKAGALRILRHDFFLPRLSGPVQRSPRHPRQPAPPCTHTSHNKDKELKTFTPMHILTPSTTPNPAQFSVVFHRRFPNNRQQVLGGDFGFKEGRYGPRGDGI